MKFFSRINCVLIAFIANVAGAHDKHRLKLAQAVAENK
jgi:hypothetical protein